MILEAPAIRDVPGRLASWSVQRISTGLWLSEVPGPVPAEVRALRAEPGSLNLVVAAAGPNQRTDELVEALFGVLAGRSDGMRLVLSGAAGRYVPLARASGLCLTSPDDTVVITPHGYALTRSDFGPLAQWRRYLVNGEQEAVGALAPSPPWERGLPAAEVLLSGATARRIPAGLAVLAGQEADAVWPDPDRVTIVTDADQSAATHAALADLIAQLPLQVTDGVRLYWPRAGAGMNRQALLELARRLRIDLIAPTANLTASGFGAVCHGPAGAAPWVRLTSAGDVVPTGSLYPAPTWELALADADLDGLAGTVKAEHVAAGVAVYRPGSGERGLTATARSLLPDPDRLTMVVGGKAEDQIARLDVEAVLKRIPADAVRRLRMLLSGAGSGGPDAFGQRIADLLDAEVLAPSGRWTATPDGRVMALPADGAERPDRWRLFIPAAAAELAKQEPAEPAPAEPALGEPAPAAVESLSESPARQEDLAVSVVMLPRDHKPSARDRQLYRESTSRYQSHVVAVRRVLTQRPGLRAAAVGDAEDAVVTDFAAVLDLMADDRDAATAALRAGSAGSDPRVACAISGFRRLPSFTGAVFTSAFLGGLSPDIYAAGAFLAEPAFVLATSSHVVALDGDIDYVIWSQTGKRLAALAADAARDEIVFPAGTIFRVLTLYVPAERGQRSLAFLRESIRTADGQPPMLADDEPFAEMDRRVLERLGAAATMRNSVRPEDRTLSRAAASGPLLIGVDARGAMFRAGPMSG